MNRFCPILASIFFYNLGASFSANATTLKIVNESQTSVDNIYFQFDSGTGELVGTINGKPLEKGQSYSLDTFNQEGGNIELDKYLSGKIEISLDGPFVSTGSPQFNYNSGGDSTKRWDKVELTQDGSPTAAANLSAVDFFSIPLQLETFENGTEVAQRSSIKGSNTTADIFSALGKFSNNDQYSAIAGDAGIIIPTTTNKILRVVNPGTVPPPSIPAFPSFNDYLTYLQTSSTKTTIQGIFSRDGTTNETKTQSYDFNAVIASSDDPNNNYKKGDIVLTGNGNPSLLGPSTKQIIIPQLDPALSTLSPAAVLDNAIYGANPLFKVCDLTTNVCSSRHNNNDVYDAAKRDFLGALNLGFAGSTVLDPKTGIAFGQESSDKWFNPPLGATFAFDNAQPTKPYYNQFAQYFSNVSDAYGFAYSDLIGNPLIPINSVGSNPIDTLQITILPDSSSLGGVQPVPEPTTTFGILALGIGAGSALKRKSKASKSVGKDT